MRDFQKDDDNGDPNRLKYWVNTLLANSKLAINQQMKRFPPIINMLYLDKEIEHQFTVKKAEQQLMKLNKMRGVSIQQQKMLQNLITSAEQISPQYIEQEIKAKLTGVFNQASTFFWYPPKELLNE